MREGSQPVGDRRPEPATESRRAFGTRWPGRPANTALTRSTMSLARTAAAVWTRSPGCDPAGCHGPSTGPYVEQLVLQRPCGLDQLIEFRPSACIKHVVAHLRRKDVRCPKRRLDQRR